MSDARSDDGITPLQRLLNEVRRRDLSSSSPGPRDLLSLFSLEGIDRGVVATAAFEMVKAGLRPDADEDSSMPAWDVPLLHAALRMGLVTDPDWERVFTAARRKYLDLVARGVALGERAQRMMVSLACQAHNNEFIWPTTAREDELIRRAHSTAAELVARAMYAPLWELVTREGFTDPDWRDFHELRVRLDQHVEEERLAEKIPSMGVSGDAVTESVRWQYEQSPYPRWFGITVRPPTSLRAELRRRFGDTAAPGEGEHLDVLVAGCGTGRHSAILATRYSDIRVTAVDISLASLAFAIRESRSLGVTNLRFRHGDILALASVAERFDVIEAIGVVHHLARPSDGLRALRRLLRPTGYLKIGVYSRRARQSLAPFQQRISEADRLDPDAGLRAERARILEDARDNPAWILRSRDFYYSSGCRDMLCHTHEVTFTPSDIADWLDSCGLEFLGFSGLRSETKTAYRERFPADLEMRNLANWEAYEADHPDTFRSLQVFWARALP